MDTQKWVYKTFHDPTISKQAGRIYFAINYKYYIALLIKLFNDYTIDDYKNALPNINYITKNEGYLSER